MKTPCFYESALLKPGLVLILLAEGDAEWQAAPRLKDF